MQLKETDFGSNRYRRITVVSNTESGLFAVQYGDDSKIPEAKFEQDTHDWRFMDKGDTYTIRIPKPEQRKVQRTIVVIRTSAAPLRSYLRRCARLRTYGSKKYDRRTRVFRPVMVARTRLMTSNKSKKISLFTYVKHGEVYIKQPITLFDLIARLSEKTFAGQ